jgi:hypothetical protein
VLTRPSPTWERILQPGPCARGTLLLIALSVFYRQFWLLPFGLIWTAHIGVDRLLGFGLKYPTRFHDTHIQRL